MSLMLFNLLFNVIYIIDWFDALLQVLLSSSAFLLAFDLLYFALYSLSVLLMLEQDGLSTTCLGKFT